MKNELIQLLDQLGIGWKYLINGVIGGIIWSIYKKSKVWTAFRQIIIGGFVSAYTTPIIMLKFNMDISFVGFTSFVTGMAGMALIELAAKWFLDFAGEKLKKIKDILIILMNNSKK